MRILFLNPCGQMGGAESALLDMVASLRETVPDWKLELIAAGQGPLTARAVELGATARIFPLPPKVAQLGDATLGSMAGHGTTRAALLARMAVSVPDVIRYRAGLRRLIQEYAPDVIHTVGFKMHLLAALAAPRRIPIVWNFQDYVTPRAVMSWLLARFSGRCSAAIGNSLSTTADLNICYRNRLPLHTVYNAVDLNRFTPEGPVADLDTLAGMEPLNGTIPIRIGLVATFAKWKGHETFLRALSLLPERLSYRAYIVGGAIYQTAGSQYQQDDLMKMAHEMGLAGTVGFTGLVRDSAPVMRALDIVVHASTQPEPFGLSVAEAMACGRAVIGSNAGGTAEILAMGPGTCGHRPGDAQDLAAAIARVADDRILRERMGQLARHTAERFFDRRRLATELIPIYRTVTQRRQRGNPTTEVKCAV